MIKEIKEIFQDGIEVWQGYNLFGKIVLLIPMCLVLIIFIGTILILGNLERGEKILSWMFEKRERRLK